MFVSRNKKEIIWGQKSVPSSINAEGVFCSTKIKRDRRMAIRPKLFISKRRLQKQIQEPRKIIPGSTPSEDIPCSSDINHKWRTVPRSKLFWRKDFLHKRRNMDIWLGFELCRWILCSSKTKHKRTVPRKILFISDRRLQELRTQTLKLSWVRLSVKVFGLVTIFSITFKNTRPSEWHTWHIWTYENMRCDACKVAIFRSHKPRKTTTQSVKMPNV